MLYRKLLAIALGIILVAFAFTVLGTSEKSEAARPSKPCLSRYAATIGDATGWRTMRMCKPTKTPTPTPTTSPTSTVTATPTSTVTTTSTPSPTDPTTTATPSSDGLPAPQSGFTRVLTDEFNGSTVDTSKWSPYTGQLSSSSGCNEPDNLTVSNGVLTMLFAHQTTGVCGNNWYHGSMMIKRDYGGNNQSVTVRFRVLNNDPVNTRAHRIIPMRWPSAEVSGGTTPPWYNGESDYCEGSSISGCTTFLHHSSSSQQVSSPTHVFDMTQWHTLRATQRVGNDVDIFIDDMTTPRWTYNGTTTTVPDVFKRTVLQQECRSSCPTDTTDSERIEIDFLTVDNQ